MDRRGLYQSGLGSPERGVTHSNGVRWGRLAGVDGVLPPYPSWPVISPQSLLEPLLVPPGQTKHLATPERHLPIPTGQILDMLDSPMIDGEGPMDAAEPSIRQPLGQLAQARPQWIDS